MMPDEALEAFRKYKDSPQLNLTGIHLHIGSQNPEPAVYTEALAKLFDAMLRIYNETGIKLNHINLGGGFPVNYLRDDESDLSDERKCLLSAGFEPATAIYEAWKTLREAAEQANAARLFDDLTLLLEPGRSIIGDAGICLTTVRNAKQRPVSLSTANRQLPTDNWLLTDAGFNILLSMETYKWYYHMISAERSDEPAEMFTSTSKAKTACRRIACCHKTSSPARFSLC